MDKSSFDWYEGTVPACPHKLIDILSDATQTDPVKHPQKHRMYEQSFMLSRGSNDLCLIEFGGHNPDPHVVSTGAAADEVSSVLRRFFPVHGVSRFDSCLDFRGDVDFFDDAERFCMGIARSSRVKTRRNSSEFADGSNAGRTFYLGSKKSVGELCVYQKGLERLSKGFSGELADPTHVRCEARVRPKNKVSKLQAATMSPDDVWGCSPWMARVFEVLMGFSVERFKLGSVYKKSDLQRSFDAMCLQYHKVLRAIEEEHGVSGLGEHIVGRLNAMDLEKKQKADAKSDFTPF